LELNTTYEVTLDLIRNNYVALRAKQYDQNSRVILFHITNNGQEFILSDDFKVISQFRKPDNKVLNLDTELLLDNNIVSLTMTEQLTAVEGIVLGELVIIRRENEQVLGTMKFNIVIDSTIITRDEIVSSSEFQTLADLVLLGQDAIDAINALNKQVELEENIRIDNEATRTLNENQRTIDENERKIAENTRKEAEDSRIEAEENRTESEIARIENETTRIANENQRIIDENERKIAENIRKEAEDSRIEAELKREESHTELVNLTNEVQRKLDNDEFDGTAIITGEGIPPQSLGKLGDSYINTLTTGLYPYYLFTKDGDDWTPRWSMQGVDGTDTLPLLGTFFLPEDSIIPPNYEEIEMEDGFYIPSELIGSNLNGVLLNTKLDSIDNLVLDINKNLEAKQSKVLFGDSVPNNTLGKEGDIYLQLET